MKQFNAVNLTLQSGIAVSSRKFLRIPPKAGFYQVAEGAHLFSYSLGDLGAFYVAYRRLMNHWHDLYPDKILDVSYEDLVNDMESETRRMLDYCALEWEPGCLKFYENRTPTTSRSARQVRAAIYTSSTGAWKRYEQFLQPLMEYFRANFINLS